MDKAIVRNHLEKIDGVSRTWFEWTLGGDDLEKTLVVEVDFDTDPNSSGCRQNVIDAVRETAIEVLKTQTTMVVHHVKIVPRLS